MFLRKVFESMVRSVESYAFQKLSFNVSAGNLAK